MLWTIDLFDLAHATGFRVEEQFSSDGATWGYGVVYGVGEIRGVVEIGKFINK